MSEMGEIIESKEFREKTNIFKNREHAGVLLAEMLIKYQDDSDSVVLAIPAGGMPIAYIISKNLNLRLEVAITRKLHVPWNPEVGFGAITWNGLIELNQPLVNQLGLSDKQIEDVIEDEKRTIDNRRKLYNEMEFPNLEGKHPIIVDDGIASGFSMLTTVKAVKIYNPKMVTISIPTAPLRSIENLKPYVDKIYCLNIRSNLFFAVASAYKSWYDLSDEEVLYYLKK
jgi:putative phosphoribosyl transferase